MSSRPGWKRLLPAVLVCLAIFAGLEATTRWLLVPASRDFRSFATYPGKAADLDASPGLRIAVFGNSTARAGVDGDLLASLLERSLGRSVAASLFVADSAEVSTWHFMMRRFLWRPRRQADLTLLLYYGDGLVDSRTPEIGRLARFFTTPADIPELFRDHLRTTGARIDYLASSWSMTCAARDRIRERILKALVPDYAVYSRRLNDWLRARRPTGPAPQASFKKLAKLLEEARENGTRVIVVALPTTRSWSYEIPDALVETVAAAGDQLLDHRFAAGLSDDLFLDVLHLADAGKAIYTRLLAAELTRLVAAERPAPSGPDDRQPRPPSQAGFPAP